MTRSRTRHLGFPVIALVLGVAVGFGLDRPAPGTVVPEIVNGVLEAGGHTGEMCVVEEGGLRQCGRLQLRDGSVPPGAGSLVSAALVAMPDDDSDPPEPAWIWIYPRGEDISD